MLLLIMLPLLTVADKILSFLINHVVNITFSKVIPIIIQVSSFFSLPIISLVLSNTLSNI